MVKSNTIKYFSFFLFLLVLTVFTGCDFTPAQRAERAAGAEGDILIGIVETSFPSNYFLAGVRMAVDEINQQGGLLGRKVKLVIDDDKGAPETAEKIARRLAANKDIVAVIGHRMSSAAIPASIIYEKAGILFISYGANAPGLTLYGGEYTFRNIPTNKDYGIAMAEFAHNKGFKKTVVFHDRDITQKNLADIFKKEAASKGVEIVSTRSYFNDDREFKDVANSLKKKEFDSLAIFGLMPATAYLLKDLDEMGVRHPVIGGGGLDYPKLFTIAGESAEGVILPTNFNPLYPDKQIRNFVKKFQEKFNVLPDKWAAQGYDAVSLFAHAVREKGTVVPAVMASCLRFLEKWQAITGRYSFTLKGDISGKEIFFKQVKNGAFDFLDTVLKVVAEEDRREAAVFVDTSDKFNLLSYIEEKTLRFPLKEPVTTLDPALISNESDAEVAEQLFLGLTTLDPKTNAPVPELAKRWEKNKLVDTLYYFAMREDVTWTNGEPVTAHDILRAIRRNLDPKINSPQVEELFILKNAEAIHSGRKKRSELGVYAVSDFAVVFELEHPDPFFPARVSRPVFRPQPITAIEQHGEQWTDLDNIQTNGPYSPVEHQKGIGIFLKKNHGYFAEDKVAVPEVRYFVIARGAVGLGMYENDELDVIGGSYLPVSVATVPHLRKSPLRNEYHEMPTSCTVICFLNSELPPLHLPLVRKAISAAIDRRLLVDAANSGLGEPAVACTPPHLSASPSAEDDIRSERESASDPRQAQQWLAEAGYPEGKGFPELTLVTTTSEADKNIARGIQTLLKHFLHISVVVKAENGKEPGTVSDQSAHMVMRKVCSDYPSPEGILKKLQKTMGQQHNTFNELFRKAGQLAQTEERLEAYRRTDRMLCQEEAVVIPLFYEISPLLVKPRVEGWNYSAIGGQQLHQWSFEEQ
jgi:ABC-type oligopeptide transport system substrate-binding subunit/ABC-type sugar transport system substrate-binding protein